LQDIYNNLSYNEEKQRLGVTPEIEDRQEADEKEEEEAVQDNSGLEPPDDETLPITTHHNDVDYTVNESLVLDRLGEVIVYKVIIEYDRSTEIGQASPRDNSIDCIIEFEGNPEKKIITIHYFIYEGSIPNTGKQFLSDTIDTLRSLNWEFEDITLTPAADLDPKKKARGLDLSGLLRFYIGIGFEIQEDGTLIGNAETISSKIHDIINGNVVSEEELAEIERKVTEAMDVINKIIQRKQRLAERQRLAAIQSLAFNKHTDRILFPKKGGSKKKTKKTKKRKQRKTKRKQNGNKRRQTKKRGKR